MYVLGISSFAHESSCSLIKDGKILCDECADKLPKHEGIVCIQCGRQIRKEGLCYNCTKNPRPYDGGLIALFYQDLPKQSPCLHHLPLYIQGYMQKSLLQKTPDHQKR